MRQAKQTALQGTIICRSSVAGLRDIMVKLLESMGLLVTILRLDLQNETGTKASEGRLLLRGVVRRQGSSDLVCRIRQAVQVPVKFTLYHMSIIEVSGWCWGDYWPSELVRWKQFSDLFW